MSNILDEIQEALERAYDPASSRQKYEEANAKAKLWDRAEQLLDVARAAAEEHWSGHRQEPCDICDALRNLDPRLLGES